MKRFIVSLMLVICSVSFSFAGTTFLPREVLTAEKLNAAFAEKLDNSTLATIGVAASTATTQADIATAAKISAESARDAALIQSGVYTDVATGFAAVADGVAFKVQGSGDVAAYEYRKVLSPNMFNAATVRDGKYISAVNGSIQSAAGWTISAFIPVVAGQQYVISGTRGWGGLCFYTSAADGAQIFSSYTGANTNPQVVTAPATATYLVFQLANPGNPAYSNIQVEPGTVPTTYSEYGTIFASLIATYPSKSYIDSAMAIAPAVASVVLNNTGSSYIQTNLNGDTLKINIMPFITPTHSDSGVFNFYGESLNNVIQRTAGDDAAPYWVYDTVVGARHGYGKTICTVTAHGKTYADVGSIYVDGSLKQWVIVDIPTENSIAITARTDNSLFTTGTLTHVSGGTHTAAFTPSGLTQGQLYPSIKNRQFAITIDGMPITDFNTTYRYRDNVTFAESYDVLEKNSLVEWLITQAGTNTNITEYNGTAVFTVSMSYVFDAYGACTTYTDFIALENIPTFNFLSFNQAATMTDGVSGPVKYYIPKSVPFTQNNINYDFTVPYNMTGFAPVSSIDITPTRAEDTGQFVDRVLQMNDTFGMAVGLLPVQDAAISVRRTNAADRALQIFNLSRKIYMMTVDNSISSLSSGDKFSVVAYRAFYKRTANRTASYIIRSKDGIYLYCDWHSNVTDRVMLPADLHGKSFTLVEKSSNVSVLNVAATNSVVFGVNASGSYGYAILKF